MKLVEPFSKIMTQESEKFDFSNPPCDALKLATDLKEMMVKKRGVGLSACQVGIPYQVFVVGDFNDPDNIEAVFNPKIVHYSEDTNLIEEGCLSFPGMFIKIKRPSTIRMRYQDVNGNVRTEVFDGVPARIIQHEYDHMFGVTFQQRATKLALMQANKQKKKLDRMRKRVDTTHLA